MQRNRELECRLRQALPCPSLDSPDPAERRAVHDAWVEEMTILESILYADGENVILCTKGRLPDSYLDPANWGQAPGPRSFETGWENVNQRANMDAGLSPLGINHAQDRNRLRGGMNI